MKSEAISRGLIIGAMFFASSTYACNRGHIYQSDLCDGESCYLDSQCASGKCWDFGDDNHGYCFSNLPAWAIVVIVIASLLFCLAVIGLICCCCRRRKELHHNLESHHHHYTPVYQQPGEQAMQNGY